MEVPLTFRHHLTAALGGERYYPHSANGEPEAPRSSRTCLRSPGEHTADPRGLSDLSVFCLSCSHAHRFLPLRPFCPTPSLCLILLAQEPRSRGPSEPTEGQARECETPRWPLHGTGKSQRVEGKARCAQPGCHVSVGKLHRLSVGEKQARGCGRNPWCGAQSRKHRQRHCSL